MPKKKGAKKLSKMSEEEKILYLEQRIQAEEELQKKKEEMLALFLKDKFVKEHQNTEFNANKVNAQWRVLMREAKSEELRNDLEILSQTFERVVDRKDSVIKALVKDLEEAEEQHSMALRSHLHNLSKLNGIHKERLALLDNNFQEEQAWVVQEHETEREAIINNHEKQLNELLDVSFTMEHRFQDSENDSRVEFQSSKDEIKNKNLEEKHMLRMQLETTIEDLWVQFQLALKAYNDATEDRKRAFEELRIKDESNTYEIDTQLRKLQKLSDQISQIKTKMANNTKENEEKNSKLREEREIMSKHLHELKAEMNRQREMERQNLIKLTTESTEALKALRKISDKGKQIIRFAEMCRRFETEQEKVLPFGKTCLTDDEMLEVNDAIQEQPKEQLANELFNYLPLENFWRRYGKVMLDKVVLDKEKTVLTQENDQLRHLLKQYLDGISVNEETLATANPLLVINNRTNVPFPSVPVVEQRVLKPTATYVEAAHIIKQLI